MLRSTERALAFSSAGRIPDALLLVANLAILFHSAGDGRIFLVSIVFALTLRYLLLSALVFADWRFPGWFAGSHLRRMVRDPSEGGAYQGGGAETPLWGHFAFLVIFGWIPLFIVLSFVELAPLDEILGYVLVAATLTELREVVVGRVIYFRSGAGQEMNASWNFAQVLALAVTVASSPVLIFPVLLVQIALFLFGLGASMPPMDEIFRWMASLWLLGVFHALLFLHDRPVRH